MSQHHYPDLAADHTWRFLGSKAGQLSEEFFQPDVLNANHAEKKSWLWIDELVPASEAILEGIHSPHENTAVMIYMCANNPLLPNLLIMII
jgi:hypothetical protein